MIFNDLNFNFIVFFTLILLSLCFPSKNALATENVDHSCLAILSEIYPSFNRDEKIECNDFEKAQAQLLLGNVIHWDEYPRIQQNNYFYVKSVFSQILVDPLIDSADDLDFFWTL